MATETVYTTASAILTRVSQLGVDLRTDESPPPPDDPIVEAITEASADIDFHCLLQYPAAQLATSRWIAARAIDCAVYHLCCRRFETPPASVTKRYETAIEQLELVRTGQAKVPGIARSRGAAPTLSQPRIDLRRYPASRIEKPRSIGDADGYRRDYDDGAPGVVR